MKMVEKLNLDCKCVIVFVNDCDLYTEESFLEIHDFFKDHNIPFADSYFIESHFSEFNYKTHPDLIDEYIEKEEIEILHGSGFVIPEKENGINIFTFHNDVYEFDTYKPFKYISTNKWKWMYPEIPIEKNNDAVDFYRHHDKINHTKTRTSTWEYFPKLYSKDNINRMKYISNVYFTYLHMSKEVYPFTKESQDCILRIANDDEIKIMKPLEALKMLEGVLNDR